MLIIGLSGQKCQGIPQGPYLAGFVVLILGSAVLVLRVVRCFFSEPEVQQEDGRRE